MKRRELEQLLDRMVENVPRAIRQAGLTPNACILATRMGVEGLRSQGVRARPLAVHVAIYNKQFADLLRSGDAQAMTEKQLVAAGARVITVDSCSTGEGYAGHVVAIVEERYVLDLTAAQFRRAADGSRAPLDAPDAFWCECRELARCEEIQMAGDDGAVWVYRPTDDREFLKLPSWSGYRVTVRGEQVISERTAVRSQLAVAPEVRVTLRR